MRLVQVCAALLIAAALATAAPAATYEVTIQNQIPGGTATGQPFSAPVAVVHNPTFSLFNPGDLASPGLGRLAREGNPNQLQTESLADPNVFSVVVGTGPFFDTQTLMIQGEPGQMLSIAWMLGRTNDIFSGFRSIVLPLDTAPASFTTDVWDAGVEANTGLVADIPFYGNHDVGPDERSPVSAITSYVIHDDPQQGTLTWNFPPSALVTLRLTSPTPADASTWGAIKALYR